MKRDLENDIWDCITELKRIVADLREAADDVQRCIDGIDTKKTVKGLRDAADKYEKAAGNLGRIR